MPLYASPAGGGGKHKARNQTGLLVILKSTVCWDRALNFIDIPAESVLRSRRLMVFCDKEARWNRF